MISSFIIKFIYNGAIIIKNPTLSIRWIYVIINEIVWNEIIQYTNVATKELIPIGPIACFIIFSIACFTISSPGSDIPGVPASEINAIFSPSFNLSINELDLDCSLNLW